MHPVAIVDYGMGNLDSVARAVQECAGSAIVTADVDAVRGAAAVILPGVGAFTQGMSNLKARGLDRAIRDAVAEGVPLLGVCLGMQLLATRGHEGGQAAGLDLIAGEVIPIAPAPGLRVPHMGWNQVDQTRPSRLLGNLPSGLDFYFVHSYQLVCGDEDDVSARTPYGEGLVAAVERDNIFGVQFHPEKSQRTGFALLREFLELSGGRAESPDPGTSPPPSVRC